MNNKPPQAKKTPILPILVLVVGMLLSTSPPLVVVILPLIIAVSLAYSMFKLKITSKNSNPTDTAVFMNINNDAYTTHQPPPLHTDAVDYPTVGQWINPDNGEETDYLCALLGQKSIENKPPKRIFPAVNNQGVSRDMYTHNELTHLDSLDGVHDELKHDLLTLEDLYKAGIIERDEYNDRVAAAKLEAAASR